MIIIVFGLPGSGKSYFASRLAAMLKAEYVNSDRLRKEMFQQRTYSNEEKALVYKKMHEKMQRAVVEKESIVLDATFHKRETRELFTDNVQAGAITFIEVWATEKITEERLKQTRPDSEADFEVYKFIKQHFEPLEKDHLLLESTNDNIDNMLQEAAAYLRLNDDKNTDTYTD